MFISVIIECNYQSTDVFLRWSNSFIIDWKWVELVERGVLLEIGSIQLHSERKFFILWLSTRWKGPWRAAQTNPSYCNFALLLEHTLMRVWNRTRSVNVCKDRPRLRSSKVWRRSCWKWSRSRRAPAASRTSWSASSRSCGCRSSRNSWRVATRTRRRSYCSASTTACCGCRRTATSTRSAASSSRTSSKCRRWRHSSTRPTTASRI